MLTEGEASLHSCVSHLLNGETAHPVASQGVVIIDAGGGIIDMSMFSITMARNRIYCEEIAPAECMQLLSTADLLLTHPFRSTARIGLRYQARPGADGKLVAFFYCSLSN